MTPVVARLVAVTDEAEAALGGRREVLVTGYPFRVGRHIENGAAENDLHLYDMNTGRSLHVSAVHFEIEYVDGGFVLVDRGSACGTIVSGRRIGGNRRGGTAPLLDGDELVVGTRRSRYVFRFAVEDGSRELV